MNSQQKFAPLFASVGFELDNLLILEESLTHRSSINEQNGMRIHNERLEFLGDAVLELITTQYLFETFPDKPEGDMTNYRSALVCGDHLAHVARKINLGHYIRMSKGEKRSGGAEKSYILANAVEAFIGAIYMTKGMESAKQFVDRFILSDLEEIIKSGNHIDSKSAFQELAQATVNTTPHYELVSSSGLDHERIFIMAAFIGGVKVGEGEGKSKKEAQLEAAAVALETKDQWVNA
jgi:ribonuclease-3